MSEESKQVAMTTLSQMGGAGKLKAMIGANPITYDDNGTLIFKFKMNRKVNAVSVKLNSWDLYDMKFYHIGNGFPSDETTIVKEFSDLYNDQLKSTFEEFTGLRLSL